MPHSQCRLVPTALQTSDWRGLHSHYIAEVKIIIRIRTFLESDSDDDDEVSVICIAPTDSQDVWGAFNFNGHSLSAPSASVLVMC